MQRADCVERAGRRPGADIGTIIDHGYALSKDGSYGLGAVGSLENAPNIVLGALTESGPGRQVHTLGLALVVRLG